MEKYFIILSLFAFFCIGSSIEEPKTSFSEENSEHMQHCSR